MKRTTSLDPQDTKRIHNPWKSKIQNFVQSPLPWRKFTRQETNETNPPGESLETVLSQKCGQKVFRDFLKSEFCEENLDFWLACQEFKTSKSPGEQRPRAARIYEEFIRDESPKQVNLDFYTREIIRQSVRQATLSCFVVAERKIYSLMENDSFPRFIESEQYEVLFDAASKQRGHGKHRKALEIRRSRDLTQHDSKAINMQCLSCTRTDIMRLQSVAQTQDQELC
ncbi:hypothetical protein PBY51_021068 [Eleginops maclovinus]|uniref:RGS domain-containing protein n=1 Tax=Eleginops maclovinus TaxID=56733 RepID=A0AAN7X8E2_ELEMC|nr:hypothetical protein PBY51_021068 [Eleginops maclovinus]